MSKKSPQEYLINIRPATIAMIIAVVAIVLALWDIRNILLVIFTSVVIALFAGAGAEALQRTKIPVIKIRAVAVTIVYILGFGLFAVALTYFFKLFTQEITALLQLFPDTANISQLLNSTRDLAAGDIQSNNPFEILSSLGGDSVSTQTVVNTLGSVFGGLINLMLIIVVSFYLSMQKGGIERFFRLITPVGYEKKVLGIWDRSKTRIISWFKGQLLSAVILGILTYVGLQFVLVMPYALTLALVAMLFGLIPYGILLATLPALLVAYTGDGWTLVIYTAVMYFVLQMLENYILQPIIIRQATGVPSVVVLLSLIIAVKLLGALGLILAIPFAVIILEIINDAEQDKIEKIAEEEMQEHKPLLFKKQE